MRTYNSMGPNYIWHVDGYDKLKLFGLALSGCIDGFSRRIMWLVCGASCPGWHVSPHPVVKSFSFCTSLLLSNVTSKCVFSS